MPSWMGRPPDVDMSALALQRDEVNKDLRSFRQYEEESHYTPKWLCPCGRDNECAVTVCNQCGDIRPPILHGDPDQGDKILGLARMVARKKLDVSTQIPPSYYELAQTWKSTQGRTIKDYRFDTERKGSDQWVSWKEYVEFLVDGGTV